MNANLIFKVFSSSSLLADYAGLECLAALQVPSTVTQFYCAVEPISRLRITEIGGPLLHIGQHRLRLVRAAHHGQLQLRFAAQ